MKKILGYIIIVVLIVQAVFLLLLPRLRQKPRVRVVQRVVISPAETVYVDNPELAKQIAYWKSRATNLPNIPAGQPQIIRDTVCITLVKATPTTVRIDWTRDYLTVWTVRDSVLHRWQARLNSPAGTVLITPAGVSLVRTRPVLALFGSLDIVGNVGKPLKPSAELGAGLKLRWARWQVRAGMVGYLPELRARWRAGVEFEI